MSEKFFSAPAAQVAADYDGQRLDNYLAREMKGAPRSLIYRLIRTGQVRINSRRVSPDRKLRAGDIIRIPPHISLSSPSPAPPMSPSVLFEDESLLAVNKPAGMAAHGGSGESHGVIERLRASRPDRFLELVHRLDKNTSGVLLLAKKASALRGVHATWRARKVRKIYHVWVFGKWSSKAAAHIDMPIKRTPVIGGKIAPDGRSALTRTSLLQQLSKAALLRADIATGRTHQLRVHLAAVGLPIIGDDKYGDFAANHALRQKRMFLHAERLSFTHPLRDEELTIIAPPPREFTALQKVLS